MNTQAPLNSPLSLGQLGELTDAELDALLAEQLIHSDAVDDLSNSGTFNIAALTKFSHDGPPASYPKGGSPSFPQVSIPDMLVVADDSELVPSTENRVVSQSIGGEGDSNNVAALTAKFHSSADFDGIDEPPNTNTTLLADAPEELSEPTFTPKVPELPEVDTSEAPTPSPEPAPVLLSAAVADDENDAEQTWVEKLQSKGASALEVATPWVKKQPRSRKVAASIVAFLLLLVVVLRLSGGGSGTQQATDTPHVVDAGGSASVPNSPSGSASTTEVAPLTDVIASMSGKCADPTTEASLAAVGAADEAWVCGRPGNYDGAILNIIFRRSVTVHSISFTPGFNYIHEPAGDDEWNRHRVITRVLVRIGGQQVTADVIPSRETFLLEFDQPIRTNDSGDPNSPPAMSITVQASVPPEQAMGNQSGTALFGESNTAQNATAMQNLVISGTVN